MEPEEVANGARRMGQHKWGTSVAFRRKWCLLALTTIILAVPTLLLGRKLTGEFLLEPKTISSSSSGKSLVMKEDHLVVDKFKKKTANKDGSLRIGETSSLPSSNSKQSRAVIHMGPHKTGSTTLQSFTYKYKKNLKEDGYYLPFDWIDPPIRGVGPNQVRFTECFFKKKKTGRHGCVPELVLAGIQIGAEGKNMLVSSETMDRLDDYNLLTAYLKGAFDEVQIVLFYRRYFEWIVSMHNQVNKGALSREVSIVDYVEKNLLEKEILEHDDAVRDIYTLVNELRKHFENIDVVNMYNGKDNNEEFFCDVLPNANRTCTIVKKENKHPRSNPSVNLIYSTLAYKAMKKGMVQIKDMKQMKNISSAIEKHHNGLTAYDFPLTCPSPDALNRLLNKSLMMEKSLLPEFFESPQGEQSLRASFEKYSKTKLCALNADEALSDAVWIDFFKGFSYSK